MKKLFNGRFSTLFGVLSLYVFLSFVVRFVLLIWSVKDLDLNLMHILRAFFTGFAFDLTMGSLFSDLYAVYLLLFPKKWIGSLLDKCFTYFYLILIFIIIYFSLLAEIPFWDEFGVRFNFIAVDYLIYTYEVVENINQSYPLPVIGVILVGLIVGTFFLFKKLDLFKNTFSDKNSIRTRFFYAVPLLAIAVILGLVMKNQQADFSNNLVVNELGKMVLFRLSQPSRQMNLIMKHSTQNFPKKKHIPY